MMSCEQHPTITSSTSLSHSSSTSAVNCVDHRLSSHQHQQQQQQQHIYEDVDLKYSPPRLAPSGVYNTRSGKCIIKPIAYKPLVVNTSATVPSLHNRFGTPITVGSRSPFSSLDSCHELVTTTRSSGGGGSIGLSKNISKSSSLSQSQYSLSQHSYFLEDDNWYSLQKAETPKHIRRHCISSSSANNGVSSYPSSNTVVDESNYDLAAQTPSPSDSGITDLEAMLREKDSEISYLRETLEHNEQVIFKVYEEKEQSWQKEFNKLRSLYESKLRSCQQRLAKAEQKLQLHTEQSLADKKLLLTELDASKRDREDVAKRTDSELASVKSRLEETEWSLCQKVGEISLLKAQFKESQDEQSARFSELVALRLQLQDAKKAAQHKSQQLLDIEKRVCNCGSADHIKPLLSIEKSVDSLQTQLMDLLAERDEKDSAMLALKQENAKLRATMAATKKDIEQERAQWSEEKDKVIRYQKQLESMINKALLANNNNNNHANNNKSIGNRSLSATLMSPECQQICAAITGDHFTETHC